MSLTKNLGFVQAVLESTTAPTNTAQLWFDTNIGINYMKYYDLPTSTWTPLKTSSTNVVRLAGISNSGNAYSSSTAITAYSTNTIYLITFNAANTGASTLNINSLGAIPIEKYNGTAMVSLDAGDINVLQTIALTYNGTYFETMSSGSGGGGSSYIRSTPTKVTTGGLPAGTVPTGVGIFTTQDALDKILYPFTNPNIGISVTPSLVEKGLTYGNSGSPISIGYAINTGDAVVTGRSILRNASVINTPVGNSGTFVYNTSTVVWSDITANRTFTFSATYSNFANENASGVINFVAPFYYGVGAAGLNESQIKSTLTKGLQGAGNKTLGFSPTLQRYYYVYPASWGNLVKIIDPNGFNITAGFVKTNITFTLADSVTTEVMNVYTSNADTTQTGFNITFNLS